MTTSTYMAGRKQYQRPQAILFSDNSGTLSNGTYVPDGYEKGEGTYSGDFLILSDHGRSPISIKVARIEKRERMVNGRMRSYHVADKMTLSVSWSMLPSRAFEHRPTFGDLGKPNAGSGEKYTVDGGAGGTELLSWYENHVGSFWVYLAYDSNSVKNLTKYSEVKEMFISDFSYSVEKRGGTNHDMWNINLSLEEA